jgi:HAD superfamily hydrolase (TIGR01509 family)
MQLEALIFDVDGTLADTERDGHRVAFNRAFADAGLDWDWDVDLYGQLLAITGGKERITFFVERHRPELLARPDFVDFVAGLHRAKTDHYTALLATGQIPLRPGIERLLREARTAEMRLAIATTTTPANVSALLQANLGAASEDWFEVIGAGDIVPRKKPAPDIYHWVLERLDLPPQACMVLEDSDNGVRSAWDAGLKNILVTFNGYTERQDFGPASYVVNHLGEPDQPLTALRGTAPPAGFLSLADLRSMHRDCD